MGVMSEIAAEREQSILEAHIAYLEAFDAYMDYQSAHDINHRTLSEIDEMGRLESVCMVARRHYEDAKANRYRIVI